MKTALKHYQIRQTVRFSGDQRRMSLAAISQCVAPVTLSSSSLRISFSRLSIPALALAKVLKPIKEVMIEDMVQSQLRPQPASNGTDHEKQIQS